MAALFFMKMISENFQTSKYSFREWTSAHF